MFREMRRKRQLLDYNECIKLLENGTSGVLALLGDNGYPYSLPISYVYHNSKIYFHSAKTGHKIDAIKKCQKASFCVIDQDHIVPMSIPLIFEVLLLLVQSVSLKMKQKSNSLSRNLQLNTFQKTVLKIGHAQ